METGTRVRVQRVLAGVWRQDPEREKDIIYRDRDAGALGCEKPGGLVLWDSRAIHNRANQ